MLKAVHRRVRQQLTRTLENSTRRRSRGTQVSVQNRTMSVTSSGCHLHMTVKPLVLIACRYAARLQRQQTLKRGTIPFQIETASASIENDCRIRAMPGHSIMACKPRSTGTWSGSNSLFLLRHLHYLPHPERPSQGT